MTIEINQPYSQEGVLLRIHLTVVGDSARPSVYEHFGKIAEAAEHFMAEAFGDESEIPASPNSEMRVE